MPDARGVGRGERVVQRLDLPGADERLAVEAEALDDLDLAQDSLEKRFRRAVGATPKQLATLLRLRGALRGYAPGASLTELALAAGYYDQSHFIRNVRAATGDAPRRFLGRDDVC